jgi:hypothetical protein
VRRVLNKKNRVIKIKFMRQGLMLVPTFPLHLKPSLRP